MNHAMGSDQWLALSVFIIFPILCIIAFSTGSIWLLRCLAVVLVVYVAGSAIYSGIGSVMTGYGIIMVVLTVALWVRSIPRIYRRPNR